MASCIGNGSSICSDGRSPRRAQSGCQFHPSGFSFCPVTCYLCLSTCASPTLLFVLLSLHACIYYVCKHLLDDPRVIFNNRSDCPLYSSLLLFWKEMWTCQSIWQSPSLIAARASQSQLSVLQKEWCLNFNYFFVLADIYGCLFDLHLVHSGVVFWLSANLQLPR